MVLLFLGSYEKMQAFVHRHRLLLGRAALLLIGYAFVYRTFKAASEEDVVTAESLKMKEQCKEEERRVSAHFGSPTPRPSESRSGAPCLASRISKRRRRIGKAMSGSFKRR